MPQLCWMKKSSQEAATGRRAVLRTRTERGTYSRYNWGARARAEGSACSDIFRKECLESGTSSILRLPLFRTCSQCANKVGQCCNIKFIQGFALSLWLAVLIMLEGPDKAPPLLRSFQLVHFILPGYENLPPPAFAFTSLPGNVDLWEEGPHDIEIYLLVGGVKE